MSGPTEKMVGYLKSKGVDASQMTFEAASALIGQLKGQGAQGKETETAGWKVDKSRVYDNKPKSAYNPASQYVSYSKDIFLELRKMLHEEFIKNPKLEVVSDDVVMKRAMQLVKIAIKEFE